MTRPVKRPKMPWLIFTMDHYVAGPFPTPAKAVDWLRERFTLLKRIQRPEAGMWVARERREPDSMRVRRDYYIVDEAMAQRRFHAHMEDGCEYPQEPHPVARRSP